MLLVHLSRPSPLVMPCSCALPACTPCGTYLEIYASSTPAAQTPACSRFESILLHSAITDAFLSRQVPGGFIELQQGHVSICEIMRRFRATYLLTVVLLLHGPVSGASHDACVRSEAANRYRRCIPPDTWCSTIPSPPLTRRRTSTNYKANTISWEMSDCSAKYALSKPGATYAP